MTTTDRTHDGYVVPSAGEVIAARAELSELVRFKAVETEEAVGFGFVGCPDAPSQ